MSCGALGCAPTYADFAEQLLAVVAELEALESFSPCVTTDAAFTKLVELVIAPYSNSRQLAEAVKDDPAVQSHRHRLVQLCSQGEGSMEKHWAEHVTGGVGRAEETASWLRGRWGRRQPTELLADFKYFANYVDLVAFEFALLCAVNVSFDQVLFIGSGPLPLTSLILARDHVAKVSHSKSKVINIDIDKETLDLGAQVTSRLLGASLRQDDPANSSLSVPSSPISISFMHVDAGFIPSTVLSSTSVVFLGALVGLTSSAKLELALSVIAGLPVGAHMLIRSADGLRALIYPKLDEDGLVRASRERGTPVKIILVAHPKNHVINSAVIVQRVAADV